MLVTLVSFRQRDYEIEIISKCSSKSKYFVRFEICLNSGKILIFGPFFVFLLLEAVVALF